MMPLNLEPASVSEKDARILPHTITVRWTHRNTALYRVVSVLPKCIFGTLRMANLKKLLRMFAFSVKKQPRAHVHHHMRKQGAWGLSPPSSESTTKRTEQLFERKNS